VENNPFAIHLPYVANAECLGRGRGKGEPMDVVMKVARRLGSTHMDLLNTYSRTEVRNSCGELLRDDIWTIAREKFPNGVKYVKEHNLEGSSELLDDIRRCEGYHVGHARCGIRPTSR